MSSNPKGSPWRSTARKIRKRPGVQLTISREALRILDGLAATAGSRSAAIEKWLLDLAAQVRRP